VRVEAHGEAVKADSAAAASDGRGQVPDTPPTACQLGRRPAFPQEDDFRRCRRQKQQQQKKN
jgi:hypothetical protein